MLRERGVRATAVPRCCWRVPRPAASGSRSAVPGGPPRQPASGRGVASCANPGPRRAGATARRRRRPGNRAHAMHLHAISRICHICMQMLVRIDGAIRSLWCGLCLCCRPRRELAIVTMIAWGKKASKNITDICRNELGTVGAHQRGSSVARARRISWMRPRTVVPLRPTFS